MNEPTPIRPPATAPPIIPPNPIVSRMTLDRLVRGKQKEPRKVALFGPEGLGKTTFGAGAPDPIFLDAEGGSGQLDVARFPRPETWPDVLEAVRTLTNDKHDFKTLVVDTADAVEPLLWSFIVARDSKPGKPLRGVEDYGYGKGFNKALDEWRVLLASLERLRLAKGMNVIFLAHAWIKPFKNPEGEDYDRFELKLDKKAGGLIKEWCDVVLFGRFETYAHKDERDRVRGHSTGARLVHTERTAAYDAKNRYNLPATLPLSWADFDSACIASDAMKPEALREEIQKKAKELGGEIEKSVAELLVKAGADVRSLVVINNRLNARLAERAAQKEGQS